MEYLLKTLLADFSRSDIYVLLFIYFTWKTRAMSKEIDGLKSGASSMLKQFGDNLTSLRESTANILKEAGEQISKSFDKTETHVEKIGEEVKNIKSESDREDATHTTQIEGHDKRLGRLESQQDKLIAGRGGANA